MQRTRLLASALGLATGIVFVVSQGACHRSGSRDPTFEGEFGLSEEEVCEWVVGHWVSTDLDGPELVLERDPTRQVMWEPYTCTLCEGNSNGCTGGYAYLPLTGRFKPPLQTGWQERVGNISLHVGTPYLRVTLSAADATDMVSAEVYPVEPPAMTVTYRFETYYLTRSDGDTR